jgi:hypothetical protein
MTPADPVMRFSRREWLMHVYTLRPGHRLLQFATTLLVNNGCIGYTETRYADLLARQTNSCWKSCCAETTPGSFFTGGFGGQQRRNTSVASFVQLEDGKEVNKKKRRHSDMLQKTLASLGRTSDWHPSYQLLHRCISYFVMGRKPW